MFEPDSRYANLTVRTLTVTDADGVPHPIRYVERRILPPLGSGTTLVEHLVTEGDRLDNIAAATLGDPTQFWRIADANEVLRPEELTSRIGRRIVISLPQ